MHFVIVLLVTGVAIGRRVAEQLCLMAFLAFHFYMQAQQRKTRTPMVYTGILPILFVMAGFAAFPKLVFVNIVLFVTRDAIRDQLLLIQITGMAGDTFDLFVLVLQSIFGIAVMVEDDRFPVSFLVASLAPGAKTFLMLVILLVASDAGRGQFRGGGL